MAGQTPQSNTQKHHIIIGQTATIVFCLSECPFILPPPTMTKTSPFESHEDPTLKLTNELKEKTSNERSRHWVASSL